MAEKKVSIKKTPNKRPAKISAGSKSIKSHNAGKVKAKKAPKASNMPSNYGVR
jgi:hypothetical protein